ncbi:SEC20 [Candida pseudojiufengensis]|uniref:SEC20 n=1 Tax=Candida pseudojiufengensis TaxID=497109 RepID=UPI0022251D18|nr:SEC20 [Candida pseudojiufengensis]KAI5963127.1 SEC20 [Candida pseudojiufengensis]
MDIYEKLNQIQDQVFSQLDLLVQTTDIKDEEEYSIATSTIFSQIHKLLLTFKDYLRIVKLSNPKAADSSTYQIYDLKYKSLKSKLKFLEIYINDTRDRNLQEWRLDHFNLTDLSSIGNESTESQMREELFSNRSLQKANEKSIAQQIQEQNNKITSSLQSSRDLLSASILQSELNIDSIDQQTKDLAKLNENFIQFSDLLNKSKGIIKFIEKQDKQDRQRIYLSVGFFLLCCSWVIYRRVLRRPIRILLWSFFKIFNIFGWLLSFGKKSSNVEERDFTASLIATSHATVADAFSATLITTVSEILEATISAVLTDGLAD